MPPVTFNYLRSGILDRSDDFVVIEWIDSCETSGWTTHERVMENPPGVVRSVGWLLREPDEHYPFYCIARDEGPHGICGVMEIPQVAVLKVEELTL